MKRWIVLTACVLLCAAQANGQTQAQLDTKFEADCLASYAGYFRECDQVAANDADDEEDLALWWRNECLTEGATYEELEWGDMLYGWGDDEFWDGMTDFNTGDPYKSAGDTAKAFGDAEWGAGHYATACDDYYTPTSIPNHDDAEDCYSQAETHHLLSYDYYEEAALEYYYLWLELIE